MSAPVRLEAEFFDDPSIDALAMILGYPDRDMAAGKMARLFSWQTEKYTADRPTYAVPRSTLIGIFGPRGPEAMVEAGLATLQEDGAYKIHGSDKPNGRTPGKTRINWLWLECQAQAERGRKRAAAGDGARTRGRFASAVPAGDQPETSRKDAGDQPPTSSLISDLSSPSEISLSGARAREAGRSGGQAGAEVAPPQVKPEAAPPPRPAMAWNPDRQLGELVAVAIGLLNSARAKVDPSAKPIPPTADGDKSSRALMDHLRPIPSGERMATLCHAVDVMVAHLAAEGRPVDAYRLGMLAGELSWPRWRDGTVAGAAKRDGPRRQPSASRGQAPALVTDRPDGAIPL